MKKVAIVHEHLAQDGGAERVVQALQQMYPKAPVFTLVYNPKRAHPEFRKSTIRTSFIQRLPGGAKHYQWYLPLMPTAVELYDLSEFDLVVSSASAFAKGVITNPKTLHVCYLHSPTRYLWNDSLEYVRALRYPRWMKAIISRHLTGLRQWDRLAADRPDVLVANSKTVQQRITKYYQRSSEMVYPPIRTDLFSIQPNVEKYFLTGGRLVPYKRFDITVQAFNRLGLPLKIFGTGPAMKSLQAMAKPNIEFLGRVPDDQLNALYGKAQAFINPQEEDFGITVVEAMATGRPVIAYAAGGAKETVKPGITGAWFMDQDWESLADAIIAFKPEVYDSQTIRQWAETFSLNNFSSNMTEVIDRAWQQHESQLP